MKIKSVLATILVVSLTLTSLFTNSGAQVDRHATTWQEKIAMYVYDKANPSIGRIETAIKGDTSHIIIGTGAVITDDGQVLTAAHVVSGNPPSIKIHFSDGKVYLVKILKLNKTKDLALLKIQKQGHYPYLKLEKEENVEVGRTAYMLGYPLGYFPALFMQGMVSRLVDENNSRLIIDIQANPGNSGGPVLNNEGNITGVVVEVCRDITDDETSSNQLNTHITIAVSLKDINTFLYH